MGNLDIFADFGTAAVGKFIDAEHLYHCKGCALILSKERLILRDTDAERRRLSDNVGTFLLSDPTRFCQRRRQ